MKAVKSEEKMISLKIEIVLFIKKYISLLEKKLTYEWYFLIGNER